MGVRVGIGAASVAVLLEIGRGSVGCTPDGILPPGSERRVSEQHLTGSGMEHVAVRQESGVETGRTPMKGAALYRCPCRRTQFYIEEQPRWGCGVNRSGELYGEGGSG
jgi:hypothetical protein